MTHQAREPFTQMERLQERSEETYAREDNDPIRTRFDLAEYPVSEATESSADEEEEDPVTAGDRWLWATVAWWKIDLRRLDEIAHGQGLKAALEYASPVTEEVNVRAFEKRFEHWVAKGCPQPKGTP